MRIKEIYGIIWCHDNQEDLVKVFLTGGDALRDFNRFSSMAIRLKKPYKYKLVNMSFKIKDVIFDNYKEWMQINEQDLEEYMF